MGLGKLSGGKAFGERGGFGLCWRGREGGRRREGVRGRGERIRDGGGVRRR